MNLYQRKRDLRPIYKFENKYMRPTTGTRVNLETPKYFNGYASCPHITG